MRAMGSMGLGEGMPGMPGMPGMGGDGQDGAFMGMMQGMMKSLLSKDVLYPSLKEITDKVSHKK